jgi:hypothetical protein
MRLMASNVAPPKNTGGGGFVFEDDVCAAFLACMLSGEPPFDSELGPPVRVDFQTRPDGWFLDDALVTTAVGPVHHRFAVSIKSNAQFTASSAPSDFVSCAWEQWLHVGSSVFQPTQDFMALVTAPLSGAAAASVSGLTEKARAADPGLFPARLATPNWATDDERHLFATFNCPAALNSGAVTDVDTARLVQRFRFLQHDFSTATSESLKNAIELCRRCVRMHATQDAEVLWNHLRGVAAELRPRAGSITLSGLVDRLRNRVLLADYPDHATDWATLDARSSRDAALVPDSIAGRIRIPREAAVDALAKAVTDADLLVLLGASGAGKSAIARTFFESRRAKQERTLWYEARSLDCPDFGTFESALRTKYALSDLLGTAMAAEPVLVLDGLDRLYADQAFRNVAVLLRLARQEGPSTKWRVVAPCQSQEWPRVLEALQRAGVVGEPWKSMQLEPLKVTELKPASDAVPALARLMLQPKVAGLLTNLKLLDLVVRRVDAGATVDSAGWVGESSVADWFWSAEIDRGADRIARGRFARSLAQLQADLLVASVRIDDFNASELGPLDSLASDQLCIQVPGDRVAFAHDLYGDWARLRILLSQRTDLPTFFRERRESPLWHRALRLLGVHLLEQSSGVTEWRAALASFGQGDFGVVHDVLLEAPVFAANARPLLDAVLPDLLANGGVLLRRLLTRFLAFATIPDAEMVAMARSVGMNADTARATYRVPHWPYWVDVLRFLHAYRNAILNAAPSEVARIVEMWMSFAPKGSILRAEAAEVAVLLGQHALSTREVYGGQDWQRERELVYACALAAAHERADDVATIALTAAERVPRETESTESASPPRRRRRRRGGLFGGTGIVRDPWPEGPRARVDDAFQNVVLDSPAAIRDLYRVRPAVAREVIIATLIEEPREEDWNGDWMRRKDLEVVNRHKWLPAFYTHGPFFMCLRENFTEGLELIAQLVEFAAARANEQVSREVNEWRSRALAEGQSQAQVDQLLASAPRHELTLLDGDRTLSFSGDERIYAWSAGLGNPPDAVEAALMALEQYFYQRIDDSKDVAAEIAAVLARSRSVALLGVLCDVGKRQRDLFEGPLRPLLSAPEIYAWEITKLVRGRSHLMIGAFDKGEWFIKLARQFHGLEHRKSDLRDIAILLMLQRPAMRDYFAGLRDAWCQEGRHGRMAELTDQLVVALDRSNYEVREDPQHGVVLVNVEALRIQEARADEHRAMNDQMLVTTFPMRCRTILDEQQRQTEEQLAELWSNWKRIRELARSGPALPGGEERFGDEYANAISGGVAVFLWHDDWYSAEGSRRTELEAALRWVLSEPPEARDFDSDNSVSTWTWEGFGAEAAAMLWARDRNNGEWRRTVAEGVFSQKYTALRLLFARCAEHRRSLGEDFARLRRLALEWAYVRDRMDVIRNTPRAAHELDEKVVERLRQEFAAWAEERVAAFVAGSSLAMPADWAECDERVRFRELDAVRRKWVGYPGMDFHVVRCSHEWLPSPEDTPDPTEREEVVRFLRTALGIVTARPSADLTRRDDQYPQDDEHWVLQRAGVAVLQLRAEERPELLWQPVLDLHGEGHDWPEAFAHSLHRHALVAEQTPTSYPSLVRLMVQRAFTEVEGKRRWSSHEQVWDAVLGIDWYSRDLWESRHARIVDDLQDVFTLWMEKVPLNGSRLSGFAAWLCRPSAAPIRLRTLAWILGRVRVDERHQPRDVEVAEDAIAALLNLVWAEEQASLRADAEAFGAFRGLLSWLGDRQNHLGLELLGRIGSLG